MMRRSPTLHFVLIGLAMVLGKSLLFPGDSDDATTDRIVVPASQIEALAARHEAQTGTTATHAVLDTLLEHYVEEEMLVRESIRWGLADDNRAVGLRQRQVIDFVSNDHPSDEEVQRITEALNLNAKDPVIRKILAQNMRLLLARNGEKEPSDEELRAFYEVERQRFVPPPRFSGHHVFFSKQSRGASAKHAATAAKARIATAQIAPENAIDLGDRSPSGSRFRGQLERHLEARFGPSFALAAATLREGQWSEPVETPFGFHLVHLDRRLEEQRLPLARDRKRVAAAYRAQARERRLAAALDEMRARYVVWVEPGG